MKEFDIIIKPVLSEKSYAGIADKTYTFVVAKSANKTEIKLAIEKIFGVTVDKVNTANYDGKARRTRTKDAGCAPAWKKAYVRLAQGESIDLV